MKFVVRLSIIVALLTFMVGAYEVGHVDAQTTPVSTPTPQPKAPVVPIPSAPTRLSIPSINLQAPIVPVGTNEKGEMDVPDGDTNDVGWYKRGTTPGQEGSAVLDAHVFAALSNLRYAKAGDDVYVTNEAGQKLHFRVTDSMVYKLSDVPRELLFHQNGGKYLHIITCAGQYSSAMGTYDYRLIVYATLVEQ